LNLEDAAVYGVERVGGLIGNGYGGLVTHCTVGGEVKGTNYVGMICGVASNMVISRCSSSGEVFCKTYAAGGIVGYAQSSSSITECCAVIDAEDPGASAYTKGYGGIVGHLQESAVSECYSLGDLNVYAGVGGIAGHCQDAVLTHCYWAGEITTYENLVTGFEGGIVGTVGTSLTCSGCYYSADGCDYAVEDGSYSGATALSTANMKKQSSYSSWDFDSTWGISEYANGGFPYLRWQTFPPALMSGSLTFDKAAFSAQRQDLAVRFAANGNHLLGVKGVDSQYVEIVDDGKLILSREYLSTLATGANTLYALYSDGQTVEFTVTVTDTTPNEFIFDAVNPQVNGNAVSVDILMSIPEATTVEVVLAVFHEEKLKCLDLVVADVVYGCNEVTLKLDMELNPAYVYRAFLMEADGLIPLAGFVQFNILNN